MFLEINKDVNEKMHYSPRSGEIAHLNDHKLCLKWLDVKQSCQNDKSTRYIAIIICHQFIVMRSTKPCHVSTQIYASWMHTKMSIAWNSNQQFKEKYEQREVIAKVVFAVANQFQLPEFVVRFKGSIIDYSFVSFLFWKIDLRVVQGVFMPTKISLFRAGDLLTSTNYNIT